MAFTVPMNSEPHETRYWQDETGQKWRSLGNICWYTNLDIQKRHEELILYKKYNKEEYPKYDNYGAIEVSKTSEIPVDYNEVMGVPITFLDKYNPAQFEILGITRPWFETPLHDKTYPRQIQHNANGSTQSVTKLNDGAVLKIPSKATGKVCYEVDGEFYTQLYSRILIRKIKK